MVYRDVLGGLAVVLEDDGDVHVDDDEKADDEVGEKVGDGHHCVPAVSRIARFRVRCNWTDKHKVNNNKIWALEIAFKAEWV